jgi:hypothetical protein
MEEKIHKLKTWNSFFDDVWEEKKTFDIRKNDRDFKEGDVLELIEIHPFDDGESGRRIQARVEGVCPLNAFGLMDERFSALKGWVVLSISIIHWVGDGPDEHIPEDWWHVER